MFNYEFHFPKNSVMSHFKMKKIFIPENSELKSEIHSNEWNLPVIVECVTRFVTKLMKPYATWNLLFACDFQSTQELKHFCLVSTQVLFGNSWVSEFLVRKYV